jgi:hypothetical protein
VTPLDSPFERRRVGVPPEWPGRDTDFAITAPGSRINRRLHHLEEAASDWSDLRLHVPPMTFVSVTGSNRTGYSAVVFAQVDDERSVSLVEKTRWVRTGEVCVLTPASELAGASLYLDIVGPRDRAVTISGRHAAVDVYGLSSPVFISTARGRVEVVDCSGVVDIRHGTHVVWAGRLGTVRLDAQTDMDLKVIDADDDGVLDATAGESIRLLLPATFSGDIEANVGGVDQFVYRGGTPADMQHREERGRLIFTSGPRTPRVRLFSSRGQILIDRTS